MTTLTAPAHALDITPEERAARLAQAGSAWARRLTDTPESAHLTFRAQGQAVGSVATEIRAGNHTFTVDEPEALAGADAGPSPVEFALGALIACQVVVYRLYAQNLGIVVDDVRVTAEGDLDVRGLFGIDPSVRPGFSEVRLAVTVTGPETEERYQELAALVDAHCPVFDLFSNPTPVAVTVAKG